MKTLVLVMLMHPDVQQKVHEELDLIVGFGQLPNFSDKERLPYLSAVLKELLR
jgi:cytochrome P450